YFLRCSTQMVIETDRSQIKGGGVAIFAIGSAGRECFVARNSGSRDSRLFGPRRSQSWNRRFGFGCETRRTVSGARALITRSGSNPLSTSLAGEDELNNDGFGRLAATHLAYPRNESRIRRSRFTLIPKHAPTLPPRFVGTAFLGWGQQSRGVENL